MRAPVWNKLRFGVYPFILLAGLGSVSMATVHVAAILGYAAPESLIGILVPGMFVVWLPCVLLAGQMARFGDNRDMWKIVLSGCPPWMRVGVYVLFGYTFLNFLLLMHGANGNRATEIRLMSGHLLVFYAVAFAVMYSALKAPRLMTDHKCPQGHAVSAVDEFCRKCGSPLHPQVKEDQAQIL